MFFTVASGLALADVGSMVIIGRQRHQLAHSRVLRRLRWLLWGFGVILAGAAVSITWDYDAETRILGFPLPAAAFELWTNSKGESFWADFVGITTLPFLVLGFILVLFLPQGLLAVILLLWARSNRPMQADVRFAAAADRPRR